MSDNTVEILSVDGDDTRIACAAWTSTSSELTEDHKNRIPQFIDRKSTRLNSSHT